MLWNNIGFFILKIPFPSFNKYPDAKSLSPSDWRQSRAGCIKNLVFRIQNPTDMKNQTIASAIIIYLGSCNSQRRMYAKETAHEQNPSALLPLVNMYQPSLKPIMGNIAQNRLRSKTTSKRSLRELNLEEATPLFDQPGNHAVVKKVLDKGSYVSIKGAFNDYYYVIMDGKDGWIRK